MSIPGGSGTPVPPRVARADGELPAAVTTPVDLRPARADTLPRELIASSGDGVVAFDRDFRHTVWNPRMEELTGVSPDAALGRGVLEILPPSRHLEMTALLERALAGETVTSDDFVWSSPEAVVERWLSAVFAPAGSYSRKRALLASPISLSRASRSPDEVRLIASAAIAVSLVNLAVRSSVIRLRYESRYRIDSAKMTSVSTFTARMR